MATKKIQPCGFKFPDGTICGQPPEAACHWHIIKGSFQWNDGPWPKHIYENPSERRMTRGGSDTCLLCGYGITASRHYLRQVFPLPGETPEYVGHEYVAQDLTIEPKVRQELHQYLDIILDTICVDDPHFVLDKSCSRDPVIRKKRLTAITSVQAAYETIMRRSLKLR